MNPKFLTPPARIDLALSAPPPAVVAIIIAHNEEDIFEATLSHLTGQGIGVYLIDNWSTDDTVQIARQFLGSGVVGIERFPAESHEPYDIRASLRRKADIARELARLPGESVGSGGRWMIHCDADELRDSPWPGVSLRDGLMRVESEGYNAVDHVVLHFVPTDENFRRGISPDAHFRHFVSLRHMAPLRQVKAWIQNDHPVDLDTFAGHSVEFPGRRLYPIPFFLRHYPIRSTAQGRKKIFTERLPRFDKESVDMGLHDHYRELQQVAAGGLIFDTHYPELQIYDEVAFKREFLAQTFHPAESTLQRQVQDLCNQLVAARKEILILKNRQSAFRYRIADRAGAVVDRARRLRDALKRLGNK